MSTKIKLLLAGVGLFFLFILFSYLVHKDLFMQFDFNTTVRLQNNISRRFDGVFSFLSDVGKFEVMTIVLIVTFVFMRKLWAGIVGFCLFGVFHIIELYGKFFVDHPPPPHFMLRTQDLVDFPQFYVSTDFSYPSGHAGRTVFLSVILFVFFLTNKKLSKTVKSIICGLMVLYDAAMIISRVYLGEHWSSDVIGGTLLGAAFALITATFMISQPRHAATGKNK